VVASEHLAGRARELSEILVAVDAVAAGAARCVGLAGEPGIGKTRLATEIAARCASRGFGVVWGRCWETGGAPAWWPWTEALRALARDPRFTEAMAPVHESLGVSGSRAGGATASAAAGSTAVVAAGDAEQRFIVFGSVGEALMRASRVAPIALFLDDMHAADDASLQLLQYLSRSARDTRVLIVATWRSAEASRGRASAVLTRFAREAQTHELQRLSDDELAVWLSSARDEPSTDDKREIVRRSGGNPLFATELLRVCSARSTHAGAAQRLPLGATDAIGALLDLLARETRSMLHVVALFGRPFDAPLLAELSSTPLPAARDAVADGIDAGVLVAAPGDPAARVTFAHALVREAVAASLDATSRAKHHARIADVLERLGPSGADASEIAHHKYEGVPEVSPAEAIAAIRRAADAAASRLASEDVARLLDRGLTLERSHPGDPRDRATILTTLAEHRASAGDAKGCYAAALEASEIARTFPDGEPFARAALAYGAVHLFGQRDEQLITLLKEALEKLAPGPSPLRALLLGRLSVGLIPARDWSEPGRLAQQAVEMARSFNDPHLLVAVLSTSGAAIAVLSDTKARHALMKEMRVLGRELSPGRMPPRWIVRSVMGALFALDMPVAERELGELERVTATVRHPQYVALVPLIRSGIAAVYGRFDEMDRELARSVELAAGVDAPSLRIGLPLATFLAARARGDRAAILAQAERLAAFPRGPGDTLAMLSAWAFALGGDIVRARTEIDRIQYEDLANALGPIVGLAEAAYLVGDTRHVKKIYENVLPFAEDAVGMGFICWLSDPSTHRVLGLLSALDGRLNDAVDHMKRALARSTVLGFLPSEARTSLELAEILRTRDGANPSTTYSADLLHRARQIALQLGMPDVLERTAHLDPSTPVTAPSRPATATPISLTREGESWCVRAPEGEWRLRDSKGVHYLAALLDRAGQEMHVLDLVTLVEGAAGGAAGSSASNATLSDGSSARAATRSVANDGLAALDPRAKAEYRDRLDDLAETLRDAERDHDSGRAERARAEIDAITEQLASAVGLGGRDRASGSDAERARVNVQRRLRDAVDRIGALDKRLARRLSQALTTGTYCSLKFGDGESER